MIGYIPNPLPDELLYSLIAYVAYLYKSLHKSAFARMLFGVGHVGVSVDFPTRIDAFVERLPPSVTWTTEQIISNMTLWPLYHPFVSQECAEQTLIDMKRNKGSAIYFRLGIVGGIRPRRTYLKYCPVCWTNDLAANKRIYWRRLFQAIGVYVCPIHQVWLEDSDVPTYRRKNSYVSAEEVPFETVVRPLDVQNPFHRVLLQIA